MVVADVLPLNWYQAFSNHPTCWLPLLLTCRIPRRTVLFQHYSLIKRGIVGAISAWNALVAIWEFFQHVTRFNECVVIIVRIHLLENTVFILNYDSPVLYFGHWVMFLTTIPHCSDQRTSRFISRRDPEAGVAVKSINIKSKWKYLQWLTWHFHDKRQQQKNKINLVNVEQLESANPSLGSPIHSLWMQR